MLSVALEGIPISWYHVAWNGCLDSGDGVEVSSLLIEWYGRDLDGEQL